jgi:16S rRNA (guanine527-N7)-methyltransferase
MSLDDVIRSGLAFCGIDGQGGDVEALCFFAREMERWNRRVNLTGLGEAKDIVSRLLYDAFRLVAEAGRARRLVDMGSGAGILAVPAAVLMKDAEVVSVDRSLRKVQFQRHIKRSLGLGNLFPVHGSIEDVAPLAADCVTAKAFGSIPSILSKAEPHLIRGGRALLPRGPNEGPPPPFENFRLIDAAPYTLPGLDRPFVMVTYEYEGKE